MILLLEASDMTSSNNGHIATDDGRLSASFTPSFYFDCTNLNSDSYASTCGSFSPAKVNGSVNVTPYGFAELTVTIVAGNINTITNNMLSNSSSSNNVTFTVQFVDGMVCILIAPRGFQSKYPFTNAADCEREIDHRRAAYDQELDDRYPREKAGVSF